MTANQQVPAAGRRSRTRLVLQGVLSLVLVVAIFYYLFTTIDLAQVWTASATTKSSPSAAPRAACLRWDALTCPCGRD